VTWFDGTDDQAREFAIRDNRVAELSAWNSGQLAALVAGGMDLLSLWHDDVGLADVLRSDCPPPRFEPVGQQTHRLDELSQDTRCPACGHTWHREAKS
jgi:hypothetical protein